MATKKAHLTKHTVQRIWGDDQWTVHYGKLKRGKGHPGKAQHLFGYIGEKLPYVALPAVKKHVKAHIKKTEGVYVAHDSMGCPRYIGRGNVFQRLEARKKAQVLELQYFSFYLVSEKKHEREIETLLIRSASFLLEFNEKKKRIGISHGDIKDYEAGTFFYERQYTKGKKKKRKKKRTKKRGK